MLEYTAYIRGYKRCLRDIEKYSYEAACDKARFVSLYRTPDYCKGYRKAVSQYGLVATNPKQSL